MRRLWFTLVTLAALSCAHAADAHEVGVSRGEYRASGAVVHALYVFSGAELAATFPEIDADEDGILSADELRASAGVLDDGILQATRIFADDSPCAPHLDSIRVTETDAVELRGTVTCDHVARHLAVSCDFLEPFGPDHRHLAVIEIGGREATFVVTKARTTIAADGAASTPPVTPFGSMVWTGVRHILTGYDHLAFLLGLLLLGGRARSLVAAITAFTVAHSITLGLAVLGVVQVSPSFVEPAIALSIAYVGVENLFVKDSSKRWRITFPFGLLHGFGFAGALLDLDLPRAQLPAALFAFNLGVELGQLGVLAVVLPLVTLARRSERFRSWAVPAISAALAVAGIVWFIRRVA